MNAHNALRVVSVTVPLLLWMVSGCGASAQDLPDDVLAAIRKSYTGPGVQTRYLDGRTDLNGDGKDEILVYLVGPMACGTGGCPTLVFTPAGSGYRIVTAISVSRPPIRAAAARTHGWRNLMVQIGGGGGKSGSRELLFNGKTYPANPTVFGPRVRAASAQGGDVVIADFKGFPDAKPVPDAKPLRKDGAAAGEAPPK